MEQTESLRDDYPEFNWVPPENFHISLYHMDEIKDDKVPLVVEHVQNALYDIEQTHAFSLGADLTIDKTIVLYISFRRNKTLEVIYSRIKELFEDKSTKSFLPHMTIARYKIPSKQQYFHLKKKLYEMDVELDFPINQIQLYQSISRPKNPIYNKVKSISLQEKG